MPRLLATCLFLTAIAAPLAATPLFTPVIDGMKEAGWGTTPDATSPSYRSIGGAGSYRSQNACQDVYVTDDPQNLYIGYYYNGDAWDDGAGASARIMFGFITNSAGTSGGDSDPWESTTKFGANNRPDFFLRQWTEAPFDERMEFGGALGISTATKGVAEFLRWNGSAWIGTGISINHYERLTGPGPVANNWGEFAIPLAALGVKTGETIKLFMYYRPHPGRPGYSDSTPFDPNCSVEALQSGTAYALNANFSYTIRSDNVAPTLANFVPDHTATGRERDVNIAFRVTDNVGIPSSGINVIVEGNDVIKNGVPQSGYTVTMTPVTKGYDILINPNADFAYEQRVDVTVSVSDAAGNIAGRTYYFDIKPDTSAPTFADRSPAPGASGIPRNTGLQVRIDDDDLVVQNSIVVRVNGTLALTNNTFQGGFAGSGSGMMPSLNGYLVTIDPETDFSFGQSVTLQASGRDRKGNANSTTWSFTITPDNLAPTMANPSPAHGANNVARNAAISFQLADNIGVVQARIHATVAGAVAITNGVFQSGFTGSLTPNGTGYNVTINRTAVFGYSQAVVVGVRAADAENNQLVTSFTFTTVADTSAPTISAQNPAAGATGIARNANVLFTLDDETQVQLTSINVKLNGVDAVKNGSGQSGYAFSYVAGGTGYACTINPTADFDYDQTVQVFVDARDTLGNQLTTSYNFTVKADDVAPWLTDLSPAASATGVNQDATIDLVIRDDSAVVNSSVVVRVNGGVALTNGVFLAPYNGALSSMSSAGGNVTLRLQRTSLFPYRGTNTVQVTARDARLNQLLTSYQFTIRPDNILPVYKNHNPVKFSTGVANNATFSVDLTDDTAIDALSLGAVIVTNAVTTVVYTNGAFRPGFSGSLVPNAENGYTFSFKPANPLPFSLPVLVKLSVRDGEGNRRDETGWSFTIQAGDATPPTISKLTPYNGQANVEPDALIYFETADNVAVRQDSIAVRIDFPDGTTRLAVTNGLFQPGFDGPRSSIVSNAWLGYDVRIDHTMPFAFTNDYTVHATVRDTSVNDNRADASWTFRIRPPDTTPPRVSATTPAANAQDVPISTLVSFVVEDNYAVLSNAISAELNGIVAFTNGAFMPGYAGPGSSLTPNALGGWNVTIDPEKDFSYGQTIDLRIRMRDTSNNTAVHNVSFSLQELPPARAVTNLLDPKNPAGRIRIKVNRTGRAVVRIYNLRGEQVHALPERFYNVGDEVEWDGTLADSLRTVGSGYYFVRITGSDINTTVRVIVVR